MRKLRFIIVDDHKPGTFAWKRFLAGCFFALSIVLIGTAFVGALGESPPPSDPTAKDRIGSVGLTLTIPVTPVEPTSPQTEQMSGREQPASTPTLVGAHDSHSSPSPAIAAPTTPPPTDTSHSTYGPSDTPSPPPSPCPSPTDTPTLVIPDSPTPMGSDQVQETPSEPPTETAIPLPSPSPQSTATETEHTPTNGAQPATPTPTASIAGDLDSPTMTNTPQAPDKPPTPVPTSIPLPDDITIFGAEVNRGYVDRVVGYAQDAGISWVRYNGILWDEVEQTKGIRNWSNIADVEGELRQLKQAGIAPVVIIRGTPAWAQKVASTSCGSPIREDELGTFASFVRDAVIRYSTSEYGVRYWELWNEPDVDPTLIQGQPMPYGCWGDLQDPFYGGRYYAEMLKKVYPAIKRADPYARVLLGGLLLDCDPSSAAECPPGRFLEGILQNDGGSFFDIVSYHGYAYYGYWESEKRDWDLDLPKWKHRGGAMLGKLDFIRQTLDAYRLKKPVMVTEIGLLCNDSICLNYQFEQEQSNYAVRTYVRALANGLLGASWYTLNYGGWMEAGLLDKNQSPRQAYHTIKFLAHRLTGATFERKYISSDGSLERYAFRKGTISYEFLWTNQQALSQDFPLPSGTQAVFRFGRASGGNGYESIELQNQPTLSVGYDPIMIEIQ